MGVGAAGQRSLPSAAPSATEPRPLRAVCPMPPQLVWLMLTTRLFTFSCMGVRAWRWIGAFNKAPSPLHPQSLCLGAVRHGTGPRRPLRPHLHTFFAGLRARGVHILPPLLRAGGLDGAPAIPLGGRGVHPCILYLLTHPAPPPARPHLHHRLCRLVQVKGALLQHLPALVAAHEPLGACTARKASRWRGSPRRARGGAAAAAP